MAAGDTTVGRRIPVETTDDGRQRVPEWWWQDPQPGDYCGPMVGYTGESPSVMFLKPNARDNGAPRRARSIQHVCAPPHVFRECADGSLEIRESISQYPNGHAGDPEYDDGWHGYLDEGHVWRQV